MNYFFESIRNQWRNVRWTVVTAAILQCVFATATFAMESPSVGPSWAGPSAGATVSDTVQLRLTGRDLKNVGIFHEEIMIASADVSADGTSATAIIDTNQFANGPVTLTARALSSQDADADTDSDAGELLLTVSNSGPMSDTRGLLGVFVGNAPAAVVGFESWLGRQVDGILGYTGGADWKDYDGSVGWAAYSVWGQIDRPVFWSIPLIPKGATLAAAAAGTYNDHYREAAEKLVSARPADAHVYVRTGWEFNSDWMQWSAIGKEKEFIGAFRQFVTTYRAVAKEHGVPDKFVFEWNVACGDFGMNPEAAYPGDAYVDIVGMDFYWNPQYDPKDPLKAWDWMQNRPYGLTWHQTFAAAHGKRTSYSEWGVQGDNAGPYIERAQEWFTKHEVVFHSYWDSNSAYPGKLSSKQYPRTAAAFYKAFHAP